MLEGWSTIFIRRSNEYIRLKYCTYDFMETLRHLFGQQVSVRGLRRCTGLFCGPFFLLSLFCQSFNPRNPDTHCGQCFIHPISLPCRSGTKLPSCRGTSTGAYQLSSVCALQNPRYCYAIHFSVGIQSLTQSVKSLGRRRNGCNYM